MTPLRTRSGLMEQTPSLLACHTSYLTTSMVAFHSAQYLLHGDLGSFEIASSIFLYPAEGAEAAVNGNDDAVHESRRGRAKPDQGPHQLLRFAEAPSGGMVHDLTSPLREASVFVEQHRSVLLTKKEPRRDGICPQARSVFDRKLDREPAC